PDFRDNFSVVDDLQEAPPLPDLETVATMAAQNNPEVSAAQAALQQQTSDIQVARSGFLPSISFDYWYGIEANQFAIYGPEPEHHRLLGSSASIQMTVPLWNWGATNAKLRQAQIRAQQARADLTLAERQLKANLNAYYAEAQTAQAQVASLRNSLDL